MLLAQFGFSFTVNLGETDVVRLEGSSSFLIVRSEAKEKRKVNEHNKAERKAKPKGDEDE